MRVLVIGDLHAPAVHPAYLQFCLDMYEAWDCDTVVFIGDIVDMHCVSSWERELDADSPSGEFECASEVVQDWYEQFPKAYVMEGNHDFRVKRACKKVGIPLQMMKTYNEVWQTPGWDWKEDNDNYVILDGVYYTHGTEYGGQYPAANACKSLGKDVVIGHCHWAGGVWNVATKIDTRFGMDTGCGWDDRHPVVRYQRTYKTRSILSCGVVIDGHAYHEKMRCKPGQPYHRSNFK